MNSIELTTMASTLAIIISESMPDDDDLAQFAIAIDLLGDNLDAIIAQRALKKNSNNQQILSPLEILDF
jgi:hypothetical protein